MYTENNSMQMKTEVETFVIEETAELIYDNEKLEKWNELVNKLDLKGQATVVKKKDKSPIPFLWMNQALINTFETLCPRKVPIADYDKTPIPVEILDLVALSINENYFKEIEIWYDDKNPDPVCVGIDCQYYGYKGKAYSTENRTEDMPTREEVKNAIPEGNTIYTTNEKMYLLGRWADVKQPLEELKEKAKKRYIEEKSNSLRESIKYYTNQLENVEDEANSRF